MGSSDGRDPIEQFSDLYKPQNARLTTKLPACRELAPALRLSAPSAGWP